MTKHGFLIVMKSIRALLENDLEAEALEIIEEVIQYCKK